MRFYGLSYRETLELPIRAFWLMNDMIRRIRAEETLEIMPAHSVAMGGDHVPKIVDTLRAAVGKPLIVEQTEMSDRDIAKAKALFGEE